MKHCIVIAALGLLMAASCGDSPTIVPPVLPHDPVDTASKALENFQHSVNVRDIGLLAETLDEDFGWYLFDESMWDDYNGDGIVDTCFPRDYTVQLFDDLFENSTVLGMAMAGTSETPWYGDSTGQTMQCVRVVEFISEPDSMFFTGTADWIFLARPDNAGEYRITWINAQMEN